MSTLFIKCEHHKENQIKASCFDSDNILHVILLFYFFLFSFLFFINYLSNKLSLIMYLILKSTN